MVAQDGRRIRASFLAEATRLLRKLRKWLSLGVEGERPRHCFHDIVRSQAFAPWSLVQGIARGDQDVTSYMEACQTPSPASRLNSSLPRRGRWSPMLAGRLVVLRLLPCAYQHRARICRRSCRPGGLRANTPVSGPVGISTGCRSGGCLRSAAFAARVDKPASKRGPMSPSHPRLSP